MGLLTLQDVFCMGSPDDERPHALPAYVRKAGRAIMPCRTAALGGQVEVCPDGPLSRVWDHACRHRSCPPCAELQTERWLAFQQARWLACDHSPGLCTLPQDRNPLWLAHVPVMRTPLFQAARATLGDWLADPQSLGAQPGSIAALHTWSQPLVRHLPVHCLVPGGGRSPAGHWVVVRHGLLLPARGVMAVVWGTRRDTSRSALPRGDLQLPAAMRPQQGLNLLHTLGQPCKTRWNVRMMEREGHGAGVVTSVARSLRGGPITHAGLVACDGRTVPLRETAHQVQTTGGTAPTHGMTLPVADCLHRIRRPVPVPQTRVVRCSGRSHPPHAEALASAAPP